MKKANITNIIIWIAILAAITVIALFAFPGTRKIINPPHETIVAVQSGDTLSKLLTAQNLSGVEANAIAAMLKTDCGVSSLRAGADHLTFVRPSQESPVDKIVFTSGPWKRVELNCTDGKWSAQVIEVKKDTHIARKFGKIPSGGVFSQTGIEAGIPIGTVYEIINLLAFEIDFERDIQPGQEFVVLYEENLVDGRVIDGGRVIYVSFDTHLDRRGKLDMYRFEKSDGKFGFYDFDGKGAIKSLKRTPIDGASVSSKFNMNRKHPVLGFTRAHKGVDFRAATGTRIPAAGAGKVVARGYNSGHGNFIKLRHANGFETLYAHMSRFQSGVNVGTSVSQGQIVGYVGSTGLSTGPHLHYEIIKNGVHVNPMTVTFPRIDDLNKAQKEQFMAVRDKIDKTNDILRAFPNLSVPLS
ncbi:MAG: peptidoglycan DD-metalloendopeptidase family protein [Rickettsiales bacterium]|jgi:murein DD-endopeptidase MepM/ murein hydrolase activator NlpD|nr:peptidoglycan DD-metalloendopeptidase family protein [Rickettsiales bacterium]